MDEKTEKILVKFLMNTANVDDLEALTNWLKKDSNGQIFKSYIKTNYAIDINMNEFDTENAKKEFLDKIKQDKSIIHTLKTYRYLKYAAAAIVIFSLGYFLQYNNINNPTDNSPIIVNNQIEIGSDKAILTLETGEEITLKDGNTFQMQNATSNGKEIVYTNEVSKPMAYNYLTTPRGAQYKIQLVDGTKVWLNSESQLKYPVAFNKGEKRRVELVYGEAYFDVSPSNENNGAKFKVFNNNQEIEVLGTEFNIKAYKDEAHIYTTLVEGKVAIKYDDINDIVLTPTEQSNLNILNKTLSVSTVDVYDAISWKDGIFSFRGKPLKEIMKVLSRWYDMDVIFENEAHKHIRFKGILRKQQSIEDIMSIIKSSSINNYSINNKTITIK